MEGGVNFIDTNGSMIYGYENKTSANDGDVLCTCGNTFIGPVAVASTFILSSGTRNTVKSILIYPAGAGVVTIKSSASNIIYASSSTALTTITGTAYLSGYISILSQETGTYRVINRPSTTIAIT